MSRRASAPSQPNVLSCADDARVLGRLAVGRRSGALLTKFTAIASSEAWLLAREVDLHGAVSYDCLESCNSNLHMSNGSSGTTHLQGTDQHMTAMVLSIYLPTYKLDDRDRT